MPIYEYVCSQCGKLNDVLQKMNDPAPEKCEGCGAQGTLSRVVSRTSFVLKGGGWYSDLYSSTKKGSNDSKDSAPASSSTAAPAPSAPNTTSTTTSTPSSKPAPSTSGTGSSSSGGDKS